jgi:hypothetical protein
MLDLPRAIQIYLENQDKFKGITQSDAVNSIRRSGGLPPEAAAPAETAPPATMPEAAPAPAPAPAPEAAPAPAYMNQYEAALSAFNQANPEAAPAPAAKGAPVDYAAQARMAAQNRQREDLQANVNISRTAQVDPETQRILNNRQARYDTELGEIDKDRQQATWMAVAQAGMKMAQSQSPYFMQALASGMEAGINGYSEAKAKAAEKKARLQDAKEDIAIKSVELRNQAIKDAVAARISAKQGAAADAQLLRETLAGIVGEQTAGDVIKGAGLENKVKEVQIAKAYHDMANDDERVKIARAAAERSRGGTGNVKLNQLNPIVNGAIAENGRLAEQLNDPLQAAQLSPAEKQGIKAKMQENNKLIAFGRSMQKQRIGMGGMIFGQEK